MFIIQKVTIEYLQRYIKAKDYSPEHKKEYFLKLSEEVGELANAMRKDLLRTDGSGVKDTIDEELWDVVYYAIALANCYDIDLSKTIKDKEDINNVKYNTQMIFGESI